MKQIVERLALDKKIFVKFELLNNKDFKIKNHYKIYKAIDTKSNYTIIFEISQKSRFMVKNVNTINFLILKLSDYFEHNFAKIILFIDAPLCSKAKKVMQELKWRIYHGVM